MMSSGETLSIVVCSLHLMYYSKFPGLTLRILSGCYDCRLWEKDGRVERGGESHISAFRRELNEIFGPHRLPNLREIFLQKLQNDAQGTLLLMFILNIWKVKIPELQKKRTQDAFVSKLMVDWWSLVTCWCWSTCFIQSKVNAAVYMEILKHYVSVF